MPPGKGGRPIAYSNITSAMWPCGFELMDAGVTHCAVNICHPFFDVRLVASFLPYLHCLGVPTRNFCEKLAAEFYQTRYVCGQRHPYAWIPFLHFSSCPDPHG